jgi:hypothetical protein
LTTRDQVVTQSSLQSHLVAIASFDSTLEERGRNPPLTTINESATNRQLE